MRSIVLYPICLVVALMSLWHWTILVSSLVTIMIVILRRVLTTAIKVSGIGSEFVIRSVVMINVGDSMALMWTVISMITVVLLMWTVITMITVVILVWTMVNVVWDIMMLIRRMSIFNMMISMMWNIILMMLLHLHTHMALLSVIAVIAIEIVSWLLELMLPEIV